MLLRQQWLFQEFGWGTTRFHSSFFMTFTHTGIEINCIYFLRCVRWLWFLYHKLKTYIILMCTEYAASFAKWYGSGGKSCCLAVGGLLVRSHPGCVEVSLSKTPNPQLLLMSWLVPCIAANCCECVCEWVNGWMRGINYTALWIKALYKCSPFTI